jgi:CSLREA domain-containing protein
MRVLVGVAVSGRGCPQFARSMLALVWLTVAADAAAATFVVNNTADANDAAPGNGVCAAADGSCTLRAAVQEANALKGEHAITLPSGTYSVPMNELSVTDATTRLTITGSGARTTTITRGGVGRVFSLTAGELHVTDVTVTNGSGCFRATRGRLTLTRVVVTACGGTGVTAFEDVFSGGAVTLDITDSAITNNTTGSDGGGLFIVNSVTATVTRTTIAGNSAGRGAGVFVLGFDNSDNRGVLALSHSTIENNTASSTGGGMHADTAFSVDIVDSVIAGNTASSGGGIHATNFSSQGTPFAHLAVVRSTIALNSATGSAGGAGLSIGPPLGLRGPEPRVRIVNSTISGNQATAAGGGAFAINEDGTVSLTNVTMTQNSSATGAAIHERVVPGDDSEPADVLIGNTIVANTGTNCALQSAVIDVGHNLEFPGTSCGLVLASDLHADPLLQPLANYGGPTPTHALPPNSPAVDAAHAATCAASPVSGVDQRGFVRPAACDIGAYESGTAGPSFTDATLVSRVTTARAVHVTELRGRIDALRVRFGLQPFVWSDVDLAGATIDAAQVEQLRAAVLGAYDAAAASGLSVTPPSFTDNPLVPQQTTIRVVHIDELRAAVVALEGQ